MASVTKRDGLTGGEQTRDRAAHAVIGGYAVDDIAIGLQSLEQGGEGRIAEDVELLFFDEDLALADQGFGRL